MNSARAAIASGVTGLAATGFLFAFYAIEAPQILRTGSGPMTLGTINDVLIIPQFLLLAWVVVALARFMERDLLRYAVTGFGILGVGLVLFAQSLLVARVWKIDTNSVVVTAGISLTGAWLLLANWTFGASGQIRGRLRWLGLVSGALCLILATSFFLFNGPAAASSPQGRFVTNIPLIIGSSVGLFGFAFGLPAWSIWLGLSWPAQASREVDPPSDA